ncbi:MAG: NusG domain II-containing protein [Candidatus Latescibacteria bacterium]|nr:NusG domain II-containing protein [Candidatus Latescibacterota bacterium]
MTVADKILIVTLLIVGLGGFFFLFTGSEAEDPVAVVDVDGREVARVPLSREYRQEVSGRLGKTVVEVRKGKAAIVRSPCPHQVCVRAGWVSRRGAITACLPNGVIVRVVGGVETGVDAVTK